MLGDRHFRPLFLGNLAQFAALHMNMVVRGLAENVHWIAPALGATPAASTLATGTTNGWMDSPPHRANMLAPEYTQTGVGCATGQPAVPRVANPIVVICVGVYALPR